MKKVCFLHSEVVKGLLTFDSEDNAWVFIKKVRKYNRKALNSKVDKESKIIIQFSSKLLNRKLI